VLGKDTTATVRGQPAPEARGAVYTRAHARPVDRFLRWSDMSERRAIVVRRARAMASIELVSGVIILPIHLDHRQIASIHVDRAESR